VKPGRPPSLPVESPDWTSYSIALQKAINRFQSTPLAIKKLDALGPINRAASSAFKAALNLRHSSVVRQLIAGVPIRVVAVNHDTSIAMLEKTSSRYIGDHSHDLVRQNLAPNGAAGRRRRCAARPEEGVR
jgi:hypothetical protein